MKSCLNQLAAVAAFTVLFGQWNAGAVGLSSLNTDKARELWMSGYLKVEQAAKAVEEDKKVFALELYEEALEVFEQVRKQFPEWNPDVVGFRIQFCTGQIRTLRYAVEIDAEKMSRPDLIQEVKRLRKARDGHEERVVALETKLAGLATSLEAAEKEKLELAANLAEQGELKAAKETWDARQKALEEELAAVTGRAAELQSQLVEAQGKQAQSAADLAKALKDKQELAEDIGDLEDEIGETRQLKKALKEAGKALKEAEEKASALTGELESVKDRLAKAAAERDQLAVELAEVKKGRDDADSKVRELEQKLAGTNMTGDALQKQNEALKAQLEDSAQKLAEAQRQVAELAAAKDTLAQANTRIQELTKTAASRTESLAVAQRELTASQAKSKELQRLVALAEAEDIDKLRKQVTADKADLAKTKRAIDDLKQELLARTETEKRLIAERNKRLDEEQEVQRQRREREVKLHELLSAGAAAEKANDAKKATWSYRQVLEMEPNDENAWARLGLVLADAPGSDAEAERCLKRAVELKPNGDELLLRLGYVQIRQEKMSDAAATLMRGSRLAPKRAEFQHFMGVAFRSLGWPDAAESAFKDAFKLDSKNADTAHNLAVLLATLDTPRVAEAKEWYQKSLALGAKPVKGLEQYFKGN